MRLYFIKTPRILKQLFAKYTWSFFTNKKEIYLTFDDGPIPQVTEFVLDQLHNFNAKATFFCIGDNIRKHPAVFSRIVNEGHSVGNHTFNHLNGWKSSNTAYIENISKCESLLPDQKTKLFRPPYGKIKRKQAKQLLASDYKIIMWDVLSADFNSSITKEKCLQNVLENAQNGSIIVFHDSIKASDKLYYALPKVLKEFSQRGYDFKAIT
ncbi:polysaccharide deacetylase family protein [Tenacibaculum discolor]|uniref:Polysaccharide deacetylase family protein n=1 Tax=Tenacibaculum discolor TaxID=361581 RepID=A0A2G1BW15_9FLAO|nr:polysaccharide deacetylase family protein [Tenacibaculum discolor]MDP2540209.1 polysaccharide deacetylase family protein [Tenacibaculum discolor]PHN98154.1 polysaccharide deacetylase family protein [Tenacibaculum discolor]PHO01640.1 polysaccharide deacetylase family protein [Rhodobacteraceae bacterium 4F10]